MNEIFISYSRKDLEFVQELRKALNQAGIDPWLDYEDIQAATEWRRELLMAVQSCHDFVFIISPNSCLSEYCLWELEEALKLNKRIIPIKFKEINSSLVPLPLRAIQWLDFQEFQKGLRQLLLILNAPFGISQQRLDAKIEIQYGQEFRIFYLYRQSYLIGRFPQCSITEHGIVFLKDPSVSRTHLTLRLEHRWEALSGFIKGKQCIPPKNGTYLNGRMMAASKWHPLRHGDILQFSASSALKYLELSPLDDEFGDGDDHPTLPANDAD